MITEDRFFGWVLIALGIVSIAFEPFDMVNGYLKGRTDQVLTVICIVLALAMLVIAVKGSPALKALAVVWVVTP